MPKLYSIFKHKKCYKCDKEFINQLFPSVIFCICIFKPFRNMNDNLALVPKNYNIYYQNIEGFFCGNWKLVIGKWYVVSD